MPTDKLTFRLIGKEASVIRLLFLKGLLLLRYIIFVSHSITRILPSSLVHGSADRALVAKTIEGYLQITA